MLHKVRGKSDRSLRSSSGSFNRTAEKNNPFFGQPGGSAVLSMQGACAFSHHDLAAPDSASPTDALLWDRFPFGPSKGMHTHSRRSRAARDFG